MKVAFFFFTFLVIAFTTAAQDGNAYKKPSAASRQYLEYRSYMSEPPYGLAKIKKIIAQLKSADPGDGDDGDRVKKPTATIYQSLSFRERFTYHMIHAESFYQICDPIVEPDVRDMEKKIYGRLPEVWEGEGETGNNWGSRQRKFFRDNKDSVIKLIKENAERTNRIGLNYKEVLVDINATAIIPFLVDFYKKERKDHDILTILLLLMENNKYPEFIASTSHKKLYEKGEEYDPDYYNKFLVLNKANEDLIMQRAMNFYNGWRK